MDTFIFAQALVFLLGFMLVGGAIFIVHGLKKDAKQNRLAKQREAACLRAVELALLQ